MEQENKKYVGIVIFFKARPGYGFIGDWEKDGEKQGDIFVHFSDINATGFRSLKKDQKVSFKLGLNNKGQLKAVDVEALKDE